MVNTETRLLICGQAPGSRVHQSGLPFTDPSGDRLRSWMGVNADAFYGDPRIGVAAMAFCYPGTDPKGGDYPPPRRCAELWRPRLLAALPKVELTLLVGGYAQKWALKDRAGILDPDHIAETYWQLHQQPRSAWTQEMDLRPWMEQF